MREHLRQKSRSFFHNRYRFADNYRGRYCYRLTLTEEEGNNGAERTEGAGQDE